MVSFNMLKLMELIDDELKGINVEEKKFHSEHEAWAVLFEEILEAQHESNEMRLETDELMKLIFSDESAKFKYDALNEILIHAEKLASEAIQCAAVARKMFDFIWKQEKRNG